MEFSEKSTKFLEIVFCLCLSPKIFFVIFAIVAGLQVRGQKKHVDETNFRNYLLNPSGKSTTFFADGEPPNPADSLYIDFFDSVFKNKSKIIFLDSEKRPIPNKTIYFDQLLEGLRENFKEFITTAKNRTEDHPEDTILPAFKVIYTLIKNQLSIDYRNRDSTKLQNIQNLISAYPASIQKIRLQLYSAELNITPTKYFRDVGDIQAYAMTDALLLENYYPTAIGTKVSADAVIQIADFASAYSDYVDALDDYYRALELVEKYVNKRQHDSTQAVIFEKIGDIFASLWLKQSYEKSAVYYEAARQFYNKATLPFQTAKANLKLLNVNATLFTAFIQDHSVFPNEDEMGILKWIRSVWYPSYVNGTYIFNKELSYYILHILGVILNYEGREWSALRCYQDCLSFSLETNNYRNVVSALRDVAIIYSLTGENQKAINYSNRDVTLSQEIYNRIDFDALIARSSVFTNLKMYDSALTILNSLQFNNSLDSNLYPSYRNQMLETIFSTKANIFRELAVDSSDMYQSQADYIERNDLYDFIALLDVENRSLTRWNKNSDDKNLLLERLAKNNALVKLILEDSLSRQKSRQDKVAITNALNETQQAIVLAKTKQQLADKTQQILYDTKRKNKLTFWLSSGIYFAIACVLVLVILIVRRTLKRKYERINELSRNKIHNFRGDITEIDLMAHEDDPRLKRYIEKYKIFLKIFFNNWKKEPISLSDELDEFNSYLQVKLVTKPIIYFPKINITETKTVAFLPSVFDTILHNSIQWGYKKTQPVCEFHLSITLQNKLLVCELFDNGTPPEDESIYLARQDSGLNILKKRVMSFYKWHQVILRKKCFIIKSLPDRTGTYIKIILPYEKL